MDVETTGFGGRAEVPGGRGDRHHRTGAARTRSGCYRGDTDETTGNTCCQAADLQNAESALYERIDQIFITGVSLRQGAAIRTATVGDQAASGRPAGLWPSDHAGVVAHLPVE